MSVDDLWVAASTDYDAERRMRQFTAAKVTAAEFWPFLAMASDEVEFGHRLALVHADLTASIEAEMHEPVLASLREDFARVAGYGDGNWDQHEKDMFERGEKDRAAIDEIMRTKKYPNPSQQPYSPEDAFARHEEMNPAIFDPSGDKADAARRQGSRTAPGDLWSNLDERPRPHQQHVAYSGLNELNTPREYDGDTDAGNDIDEKYKRRRDEDEDSRKQGSRSLTFFHAGRGEWVTAAAQESPGNPYYPDPEPEVGPNQGQSGYPNMAPDPPNRTLDQYQNATPAAWSDQTPWTEQGNAATGQYIASRHTAAPQEMGYWHDGQSNPGYFADGSEGLTGGGVEGAPPPIQGNPDAGGVASGGPDGATSAEPIESRADWYQNMTGMETSPGVTERDGTEGQSFEPGTRRGAQLLFDRFLASRLPFA